MADFSILRDLCKEKGMTLVELANMLDTSTSALQSIMKRGRTNTEKVERLAQALGVPESIFFNPEIVSKVTGLSAENSRLRDDIKHLRELLGEKERTISIIRTKK